jgi:hypothetical protein
MKYIFIWYPYDSLVDDIISKSLVKLYFAELSKKYKPYSLE